MPDGPRKIVPALSETDIDGIERDMLDQAQRRIAESLALRERAEALIAAGVEATAAFEQASREQEAARFAKHPGEPAEPSIRKRALELARKGVHPSVALRAALREHNRREH